MSPTASYGFLWVPISTMGPCGSMEQFRITMMMTTVVMMSVLVTMIMLRVMMMMRKVAATVVKMTPTVGLRLALSGLTIRAGNSRAPPQAQGVLRVQPMA